jgi:integrase
MYDRPLDGESLAPVLRANVVSPGVTRKELLQAGKNRQPLRVHDLRGSMITHALANGRSETWVQDRTGHTSSQMVNRYRRAVRAVPASWA